MCMCVPACKFERVFTLDQCACVYLDAYASMFAMCARVCVCVCMCVYVCVCVCVLLYLHMRECMSGRDCLFHNAYVYAMVRVVLENGNIVC